jgi:cytochrome c
MSTRIALVIAAVGAMGFAGQAMAADPDAGAKVFKTQCGTCHTTEEGKNRVGPSLHGIVGRTAGQVAGFKYSPANKGSGITWDEATLDKYLTSPRAVVPGTIMTYVGLKDDTQRGDLIAFLKSPK